MIFIIQIDKIYIKSKTPEIQGPSVFA